MPFTLNALQQSFASSDVSLSEQTLIDDIKKSSGELNAAKVLEMQLFISRWTITVNMHSAVIRTLGDTFRGVIQKF